MVSLLSRDDGREGGKGEVNTREAGMNARQSRAVPRHSYCYSRHQVCLELVQINVEGAVETKGCGNRGDDLRDETVQVGEAGRGDSEPLLADVVNGFVVNHERAVRVLESGVSRQDGVVGFNDGVSHRRRGVHAELELGLLAIVRRQTLENESTEAGASSTTERVEDEEALEAVTVVCKTADLVHDGVDHLFAHGVVPTGVCTISQFR